jgi:hypothetical protein
MAPELNIPYIDPSTTESHIQIQALGVSWNKPITLPPHSIATLEIAGR